MMPELLFFSTANIACDADDAKQLFMVTPALVLRSSVTAVTLLVFVVTCLVIA